MQTGIHPFIKSPLILPAKYHQGMLASEYTLTFPSTFTENIMTTTKYLTMPKHVLLFEAFDSQEADDLRDINLMPPQRYLYHFTFKMDAAFYSDTQECRNRVYDNMESFQSVISVLNHAEIDDIFVSTDYESPETMKHELVPKILCSVGFTSLVDQYTMAPLFNKHMGHLVFDDTLETNVEKI
jgi:hypothetical protein